VGSGRALTSGIALEREGTAVSVALPIAREMVTHREMWAAIPAR
jgi:hypothetical protein